MNNTKHNNTNKNQQTGIKHRARKATFAENPGITDIGGKKKVQPTNPYSNNNTTNNNTDNTHTQKKQRQNNNNTTTTNNNNKAKDKSKVTSYFASTPARVDERIRNSRASLLANRNG